MNEPKDNLISRALRIAADEAPRHRNLPEPRYFWLTSRLIHRQLEQERALKPIGVLQAVSHMAVAICWAIVITWKWADIKSWFATPDMVSRLLSAAMGAGTLPLSFLVLIGGLLCITTVVLLHSVLAEE